MLRQSKRNAAHVLFLRSKPLSIEDVRARTYGRLNVDYRPGLNPAFSTAMYWALRMGDDILLYCTVQLYRYMSTSSSLEKL